MRQFIQHKLSLQLENTILEEIKFRSMSNLNQLQAVSIFTCPDPLPICECFMESRVYSEDWKIMAEFPCGISAKYLFVGLNCISVSLSKDKI